MISPHTWSFRPQPSLGASDQSQRRIVVVGAGGQALVAADIACCARAAGSMDLVVGLVDDNESLLGTLVGEQRVLGPISAIGSIPHEGFVVAIGENVVRRRLLEALQSANESPATLVHPFTSIALTATIGPGTLISAGVVVLPNVTIGRGAILNTRCSVDHDSLIEDFVHIGPGVTIGGRCWIGEGSVVSIGATVCSGVRIGRNCTVGAGAVVLRDLPDGARAWGVPARMID
jgi:sugar O-acyltransferase (sialic acid O-acetyltransferase NeuD family)